VSSVNTHSLNFSVSLRAWAWAANVLGMSTGSPPRSCTSAGGRITCTGRELQTASSSFAAS